MPTTEQANEFVNTWIAANVFFLDDDGLIKRSIVHEQAIEEAH